MKTKILPIAAVGLLLLTAGASQAQEWSFGPKVNLGLSSQRSVGDQTTIGPVQVNTVDYGDAIGASFGAFARHDRTHWYAQAEVSRGRYSLANIEINGAGGGFPLYPRAARTDVRLVVGVKPLPWLRLSAGLVGVRNNWQQTDYNATIRNYELLVQQFPDQQERYQRQVDLYRVADVVQNSLKRTLPEGQLGVGADVGGLMLDLTYNRGLSPVVNGVQYQQQTYSIEQRYSYWSLQLGYRLFPLKAHTLAPRKNRAYERIKQDIPFYRNEIHVAGGMLAEDIGSAFLYENRYTRYLSRRIGLTAGLNLMRVFETFDSGFLPKQFTQTQLITGLRFLPLYSRRHTIGLSVGPTLTYQSGLRLNSGGSQLVNGKPLRTVNFSGSSRLNEFRVSAQATVDYNVAATDRIVIGPWLRATPDNAYFGVQAGYRF